MMSKDLLKVVRLLIKIFSCTANEQTMSKLIVKRDGFYCYIVNTLNEESNIAVKLFSPLFHGIQSGSGVQ